jgi:hypothetical protein
MRKLLFNYSFYSHPEIEKFQGVTVCRRLVEYLLGVPCSRLTSPPLLFAELETRVEQLKASETDMKNPVGDRPRGPLKQWGNPHLNPCIEIS